jgi:hypothetical protein
MEKLLPYRPHEPFFGADTVGIANDRLREPGPNTHMRPISRPHHDSAATNRFDHGPNRRSSLPESSVWPVGKSGSTNNDTTVAGHTIWPDHHVQGSGNPAWIAPSVAGWKFRVDRSRHEHQSGREWQPSSEHNPASESQAGDVARPVAKLLGAATFVHGTTKSQSAATGRQYLSADNGQSQDRHTQHGFRRREYPSLGAYL